MAPRSARPTTLAHDFVLGELSGNEWHLESTCRAPNDTRGSGP